jgi:hypothetical protein
MLTKRTILLHRKTVVFLSPKGNIISMYTYIPEVQIKEAFENNIYTLQ